MGNNFQKDLSDSFGLYPLALKILRKRFHKDIYPVAGKEQFDFIGMGLKIELKEDKKAATTGNLFVEWEAFGKPSGVSITESDYYLFAAHLNGEEIMWILIETIQLLKLIASHAYEQDKTCFNLTGKPKGYLFPIDTIISQGEVL